MPTTLSGVGDGYSMGGQSTGLAQEGRGPMLRSPLMPDLSVRV
jgi:hypothetical protein